MNTLVSLTQQDFSVRLGTRGPILCTNVDGLFFVLFYTHTCGFCQTLFPVFNQLSQTIRGCRFGAVNVGQNIDIPRMSLQTIAPIRYVPFIIVYWNGKPYMQYDGERSYPALRNFAIQVGQTVAKRRFKKFVGNIAQQPHNIGKPIPAYTVGKPLCGEDGVCYLTELDAYTPGNGHNQTNNRHMRYKPETAAYSGNAPRQQRAGANYQHAGALPPNPDPSGMMGNRYQ